MNSSSSVSNERPTHGFSVINEFEGTRREMTVRASPGTVTFDIQTQWAGEAQTVQSRLSLSREGYEMLRWVMQQFEEDILQWPLRGEAQ